MMNRDRLRALAERVEALTGPCRETDARIWCALNGKKYQDNLSAYGQPGKVQVEFTEPPRRTRTVTDGRGVPHAECVTASLDAAMSLVPEGWRPYLADFCIEGRCRFMLSGPKTQWVEGLEGKEAGNDWYQSGVAATPALALTAAALRAIAAQGE
jgi:hypothetical protein